MSSTKTNSLPHSQHSRNLNSNSLSHSSTHTIGFNAFTVLITLPNTVVRLYHFNDPDKGMEFASEAEKAGLNVDIKPTEKLPQEILSQRRDYTVKLHGRKSEGVYPRPRLFNFDSAIAAGTFANHAESMRYTLTIDIRR